MKDKQNWNFFIENNKLCLLGHGGLPHGISPPAPPVTPRKTFCATCRKKNKTIKLCFVEISGVDDFSYLPTLWGIVFDIPRIKLPDGGNNFWGIY